MFFQSQPLVFFKFLIKTGVLPRFKHSWSTPQGFTTSINMYNCVTRQKEPFIVNNKNAVTWYTCGPTVYDYSHLGHASCYVKVDIIQRILRQHFGLNLVTCMNITDIDDKIIKKSNETKELYQDVSKKYEREFWEDLDSLRVNRPNIVVRVTENIDLIINFIRELLDSGVAYKGEDNSLYFDVSNGCRHYGKLQNISDTPHDPKNKNKKSPIDFALWKHAKENEPSWDSPWGSGRPGWHIECSALASHIFGRNIDIHSGGIDLRFPHHENEEAQSCAFYQSSQWVNYWLHIGHLHLKDSEKMSKSLKNTVSIREMLKDTEANVFRLACAMSHYNSPMEYSKDLLNTSNGLFKNYKNFLNTCTDVERGFLNPTLNGDVLKEILGVLVNDIDKAFGNDFNTPEVITVFNQLVSKVNSMVYSTPTKKKPNGGDVFYLLAVKNIVCDTLGLFGLELKDSRNFLESDCSSDFIEMLVNFRQEVRQLGLGQKNQDLLRVCDDIRDSLTRSGVSLKDHGKITSWSR